MEQVLIAKLPRHSGQRLFEATRVAEEERTSTRDENRGSAPPCCTGSPAAATTANTAGANSLVFSVLRSRFLTTRSE